MSVFAKAAAKVAAVPSKSTKKKTIWELSPDNPLNAAVKSFIEYDREIKTAEAKKEPLKRKLREFGTEHYIQDYVNAEFPPESPMVIQSVDGETLTFVVQDRTSEYKVTEETKEAVAAILGEDGAKKVIYEETIFKFNRDLMAIPGVSDIVGAALETAMKSLVKKNLVTEEQSEQLIVAESKTSFKPGLLKNLTGICGADTVKVSNFLEAMGSSCTRYCRV